MDTKEAKELLEPKIQELRVRPYGELRKLLSAQDTVEVEGHSGKLYQLEVQAVWDDRAQGHLRIMVSIDDGGWRA